MRIRNRWALLLERLESTDLGVIDVTEACEVLSGLYRQIHVPAPPQMRHLTTVACRWAADLATAKELPVPRRMIEQAAALAQNFATDPDTDGTLIHTDLHQGNVLAGSRQPWLAIDPKPLSGDPHFELAPVLWNRYDLYGGRFRKAVRDRFIALVDAAELDEARARAWALVRLVKCVKDEIEENADPDRDWTEAMVSIANALQG